MKATTTCFALGAAMLLATLPFAAQSQDTWSSSATDFRPVGMRLDVGYPAKLGIVAQMLARHEIATPGLLNPLLDVPDGRFDELARHGITVAERWPGTEETDFRTVAAALPLK